LAKNAGQTSEQIEIERLTAIYQGLPPKKFALAQGLIVEAARLRARCDALWEDLAKNGEVEQFSQGDQEPYERERPASRIYTAANKAYQTIIRQLNEMVPDEVQEDQLGGFDCE